MTAELRLPDFLAYDITPDYEYDNFRVWTGAHIQYIQEPSWLLEQTIQKGGMTLVYGEPGSGKSLLTIAWANILASQQHRDWMGFARRQSRRVLYVVGEGQRGIAGRVRAWMDSVGLDPEDESQWPPVQWVDQAVTLWRTPGSPFMGPQLDILKHVEDHGIEVVILDTLATTFGGGNENQQQDMNTYLEVITRLQELGAAVVVVHHNAKRDDEPRGSTVLKGFTDTSIQTKANIENGAYIYGSAEMRKQKDGTPWGRELHFRPFRNGQSLALVEADSPEVVNAENTEERMRADILELADGTRTKTQMKKDVAGANDTVSALIDAMIEEGIISGGNRGQRLSVVPAEQVEKL